MVLLSSLTLQALQQTYEKVGFKGMFQNKIQFLNTQRLYHSQLRHFVFFFLNYN